MRLPAPHLLPLIQEPGSFWLPPQASAQAGDVDSVFYYIFYISLFFFLLIVGLMVLFIVRYRRRADREPGPSRSHNLRLELTWTIIPVLIVISIFYLGFRGFLDLATPPRDAYEIQVTGQKWQWLFTYPNGHVDEELHVPVDVPVRLVMTSEDVIHSLYIPAFRIKKDVVPGRYTRVWFDADRPGQYELLCAEYCGTGHSDMHTWVVVHEPGGFERWLAEAGSGEARLSPVALGERLYRTRGCKSCHTVDGSGGIGPTFKDAYGHAAVMEDGTRLTVDENYLRESILDPQARIVAGFEPVMPTFQGRLSDQEITAIISYIKSLSEAGRSDLGAAAGEPGDSAAAVPDSAAAAARAAAPADSATAPRD